MDDLDFILGFAHVDEFKGILSTSKTRGNLRKEIWMNENVKIAQWSDAPTLLKKPFYNQLISDESNDYYRKIANIVASDCRTLDDTLGGSVPLIHCAGTKYNWIKTSPNYRGLKLTVSEPEDLFFFPHDDPRNKNRQFFNKISLGGERLFNTDETRTSFVPSTLLLNEDMITIIGSRGSGKSLLLHLIANLHNKMKNIGPELDLSDNFSIIWTKEDQTTVRSDEDNINDIEYIHVHQSEVKGICEDIVNMDREISKMLDIAPFKHDEKLDEKSISIIDDYISAEEWINEQENDITIHSEEYLQRVIKENQNKISLLTTINSKKQIEEYRRNQEKIMNARTIKDKISEFIPEALSFQREFNEIIDDVEEVLEIKNQLSKINIVKNIDVLKDSIGNIEEKEVDLEKKNESIKKEFKDRGIRDVDFKIDNIEIYNMKLKESEAILEELKRKKKKVSETFKLLQGVAREIRVNLDSYEDLIRDRWNRLKKKKYKIIEQQQIHDELLAEIDISPEFHFDIETFYEFLSNNLNKNKFRATKTKSTTERIKDTFNVMDVQSYFHLLNNEKIITITDEETINLCQLVQNVDYFLDHEKFLKNLFDSQEMNKFCKVIAISKYEGKRINSLSMGQRGTLYLRIKLTTAPFSIPFVFDQPEDDLDNDFIQNHLVPLFKRLKKYRQIIIATHNANLVVNCNAEQVIIAKNENENISYISGYIDDPVIKDNICNLLEGGEEAFKKRSSKYGIQYNV
ncbi:MAG: hypothetical protein ACFFCS_24170 [Candidatus Hodarchaeota archaeon]